MTVAAALLSMVACACGAGSELPEQCVLSQPQAIYGGGTVPPGGSLAATRRAAIAAVWADAAATEPMCTATLVEPGWVLTAAHCAGTDDQRVTFDGGALDGGAGSARVCRSLVHPELDVMLMQVADTGTTAPCATPLELDGPAIDDSWLGRDVTLAGWGLTDEGTAGELRFVSERLARLDAQTVDVEGEGEGKGRSGACLGDSGGPLLLRDEGDVRVIGVLSTGSASCTGIDRYVRIDAIEPWLRETLARQRTGSACEP